MSEVEAESREEDQDDARSRHIIGKVFGNSGYGAARVRGVVPRCMESMGRSRPPCTPSHQPLCARVLLYLRAGWRVARVRVCAADLFLLSSSHVPG